MSRLACAFASIFFLSASGPLMAAVSPISARELGATANADFLIGAGLIAVSYWLGKRGRRAGS